MNFRALNAGRFALLSTLMMGAVACAVDAPSSLEETGQTEDELYVLSPVIWKSSQIPVCWETAGNDTQKQWVRQAVEQSWEFASDTRFYGWGTCAAGAKGIRIDTSDSWPRVDALGAGLDGRTNGMHLNFWFNFTVLDDKGVPYRPFGSCQNGSGGGTEGCIKSIAAHEFGHALGFAHEQNRSDRPATCTEPAQGTNGDTMIGRWDLISIMNYCNPTWNNAGRLSTTDMTGLRQIYGAPADQLLSGDFNGDGKADIALAGGLWWDTLPVGLSVGDGTFLVTNRAIANFAPYATQPGAKPVTGDFNGDGKADIALTGGIGWTTVPVAFSNGDGTFRVTNLAVTDFPGFAATPGVRSVAGDFNGDGKADIALTGGAGWGSVPVAFSNGDGTFRVTNMGVASFPAFATQTSQRPVAGDFNGDGKADIALTGGAWWNTVPIAFSRGDGTFNVTNTVVSNFPTYAAQIGARPVAGDFNGDGKADLALTGGIGWTTVPVAYSNGAGGFSVSNTAVSAFPTYAAQMGAKPVAGDFNGDGKADIALSGGIGWGTVPVAFTSGASFNVTNRSVTDFPVFAAQ